MLQEQSAVLVAQRGTLELPAPVPQLPHGAAETVATMAAVGQREETPTGWQHNTVHDACVVPVHMGRGIRWVLRGHWMLCFRV